MPPSKKKKNRTARAARRTNPKSVGVRLVDIRLVNSHILQSIASGELPSNSKIDITVNVGTSASASEPYVLVRPRVVFSAWYDDAPSDDPAIIIDATFQLQYDLQTELTSDITELITQSSMLHSWPFFREYLQSQITRMGLPPILLPLLALPPDRNAEPTPKKKKK